MTVVIRPAVRGGRKWALNKHEMSFERGLKGHEYEFERARIWASNGDKNGLQWGMSMGFEKVN